MFLVWHIYYKIRTWGPTRIFTPEKCTDCVPSVTNHSLENSIPTWDFTPARSPFNILCSADVSHTIGIALNIQTSIHWRNVFLVLMLKMFYGGVAGAPRPYQADQSSHLPYYVKLTEALTGERECLSAPAGEFPPPSPLLTVQRDTHTQSCLLCILLCFFIGREEGANRQPPGL